MTFQVVLSNGDSAEADDSESAVYAAKTLIDEAEDAGASGLTASFYAGGRLVRYGVSRLEIGLAA